MVILIQLAMSAKFKQIAVTAGKKLTKKRYMVVYILKIPKITSFMNFYCHENSLDCCDSMYVIMPTSEMP